MQVQQPQRSTSKELQCPMCFLMFPMQHIQEQADNCSPWAMESEQSPDLSECEISVEMEAAKQLSQLNMSQYKSLLKDEIARCPTRLSTTLLDHIVPIHVLSGPWCIQEFCIVRKPLVLLCIVFGTCNHAHTFLLSPSGNSLGADSCNIGIWR